MSSGSGGTTTVQQNGPPAQFLQAYEDVNNRARTTASAPYTPYSGNIVAPLSPDQNAGISAVRNSQGIAAPYINSAADYINRSTTPLWNSTQQFSPGAVRQYESPYTDDVVHATEAEFNNQNQQQQQGVIGDAISKGAWGGDRSAVAQGILAGQQQLAQAPVIAGLKNTGYQQALQEFNQQQGAQLGANQANAWLNSQAGFGAASLGNEAQSTSLSGANALLGIGGLEQGQAQSLLNVPYQQYTAGQAYPFQTTGWLANIAEGLGGASGGSSSTTVPGPSIGSQVGGAALAGAGILGQSGAFGSAGNAGWLSGLFGSGAGAGAVDSGIWDLAAAVRRGGVIPHRAPGGMITDESMSIIPGASGFGASPSHPGSFNLNSSTGSTTTSNPADNPMSSIMPIIEAAAMIALAAKDGGKVPHRGIVVPFPEHRTKSRGIVAANDDWGPQPQHARAGGGSLPISITMSPGNYAGSSEIPRLAVGPVAYDPSPTGIIDNPLAAGAASGIPDIANYLSSTLGTASFLPPPVATPPVTPTPDPTPPGIGGAGILENAGFNAIGGAEGGADGGGGQSDPAGSAAEVAGGGGGTGDDDGGGGEGGGESEWRGGNVRRRADGGPTDDDSPGIVDDGAWDTGGISDAASAIAPTRSSVASDTSARDPWNTALYAGLGILGGTSPHAAVNIGRGALSGIQQAEAQRLRQELAQYRAKQADSLTAYRQGTLDTRERGQDLRYQASKDKMDQQLQLAMIKAANRAGSHASEGDVLLAGIADLTTQQNPATGQNWTRADAYRELKGLNDRRDAADRLGDQRDQKIKNEQDRLAQTDAYHAQMADLKKAGMADANARSLMANATRRVAMDLRGTLTLQQAVQDEIRNWQGAPSAAGAPAPSGTAPKPAPVSTQTSPLDAARDAIARGAPRDAVIQRLRQNGIDPSGL